MGHFTGADFNYLAKTVINSPYDCWNYFWPQPADKGCKILVKKASEMIIPSYTRQFIRLAGISGAIAVALGAYGAHAFYNKDVSEELKKVYETANRYHFIHSLALLGVPLCRKPLLVGSLLVAGNLIFSGTCYYYALTGSKTVRQYTPYGGMLLIAAWIAMTL